MSSMTLPDGSPRPSGRFRPGPDSRRFAHEAAVREAARALVEGTAMSYGVIGAQVGAAASVVWTWAQQGGWRRHPDAPPPGRPGPRGRYRRGIGAERRLKAAERLNREAERERPRPPRSLRTAGQPYRADTVGAVRRLVEGSALSLDEIARRVGVSRATVSRWARRPGWRRSPDAPPPDERRWRPAPAPVRAEARRLVETSLLPAANIAARVGVQPETVLRWANAGGWRSARRDDMNERGRRAGGWRPYQLR